MKKLMLTALLLAGFTANVVRAEEITIKGEAQCAKCSLKVADKCASAIVVKDGNKETTYYVADNDAAKKGLPHTEVCTAKKNVEAKGTVKEVDGKKMLTVSSIKVVK